MHFRFIPAEGISRNKESLETGPKYSYCGLEYNKVLTISSFNTVDGRSNTSVFRTLSNI